MMKVLCNLNLFAFEQTIYVIDDMGTVTPVAAIEIEQLPEVIAAICSEHGARKAILTGNEAYAQGLSDEIKEFSSTHYNDNNIEVEII
jgi:hypothetical protein